MFYVYIIQSQIDHSYYKGFSENPFQRIIQHNEGSSKYTSSKMPWNLVYLEIFTVKKEALIRERKLKKYDHSQIEALISSSKNKLEEYLQFIVG